MMGTGASTGTAVIDAGTLTLRPVTPEDRPFLFAVYAGTREEELAPVPWTAEQKEAFLRMQFDAQDAYYRENYVGATFDVILLDGIPAGRLYVMRGPDDIHIIDIAVLRPYRGKGIGTALLRGLQDDARAAERPLSIHVERMNPALRLYERLGFHFVADRGIYLFMQWQATEPPSTQSN
jgi:ribosomal protein S18 acetylase RimI-like enzyme